MEHPRLNIEQHRGPGFVWNSAFTGYNAQLGLAEDFHVARFELEHPLSTWEVITRFLHEESDGDYVERYRFRDVLIRNFLLNADIDSLRLGTGVSTGGFHVLLDTLVTELDLIATAKLKSSTRHLITATQLLEELREEVNSNLSYHVHQREIRS
jgi:hypothetical protein